MCHRRCISCKLIHVGTVGTIPIIIIRQDVFISKWLKFHSLLLRAFCFPQLDDEVPLSYVSNIFPKKLFQTAPQSHSLPFRHPKTTEKSFWEDAKTSFISMWPRLSLSLFLMSNPQLLHRHSGGLGGFPVTSYRMFCSLCPFTYFLPSLNSSTYLLSNVHTTFCLLAPPHSRSTHPEKQGRHGVTSLS